MMRILLIFISLPLFSYGQMSTQDIFKSNPITWLGFDFSLAYINAPDITPSDLVNRYAPDWNDIIFRERDKFRPLIKVFHRSNALVHTDEINQRNSSLSIDFTKQQSLDRDTIKNIIKYFDLNSKSGLAAVVFIDKIDKETNRINGKLAIFDMKTKKLLLLKKIDGKGSGFGVRNFWANGLNEMLKCIERKWDDWGKKVLID